MILPIYAEPQAVLHKESAPIAEITPQIRQLAEDMRATMHNAQGIGLAAPQVGELVSLVVIEIGDEKRGDLVPFMALVNPRITWKSPQQNFFTEACLSIPGIEADVKRPSKVRVKARTLDGDEIQINADDLLARVLQHEIDHLHGILFTSHVPKKALMSRPLVDYPRL